MGKTLRTAALIVGAVALTATGVGAIAAAAAGPGFVAVSVAGVSMSTWTALAAGAGLVTMGTSLTAPGPSMQGNPTSFRADPQAGIPYAIGRTWNSGNIIYRKAHPSPGKVPNDRQTFVVILSGGGPAHEIEAFYADKTQVTFNGAGAATGHYANYMWQRTQLGATPEAAALSVSSGDGTPPPGWTAQHKLSGYAAAIWTLRWDNDGKKYPNGVPQPGWVGKWVKVYDPRLDSTYPGGNGPCRPLQEDTYVWSENPYLHGLTWCLGRWQNGKRVLGIGAPIEGINVAAFVEGANIADANGWKAGGVAYSTDRKWDVLKQLLQAGSGEPMPLGARISCRINAPRVSLDTVTAADVVGEATVAATQSRRERFNAVIPQYRSEAHGWEMVPASKIVVAEHVAEDGGERCKEIAYTFVQQAKQAAELARYDIENAREFGPIVLPLKPRWIGYKPGDCITVDLPELGLNGQTVLILRRSLDPSTGIVTLTCRSETAAKHAFALGQTATPPPTPGVSGPPLIPVPSASEWTVSATSITAGGVSKPALVISGAATTADPDRIVFEYRQATGQWGADEGWISVATAAVGATRQMVPGVLPGTAYEVAVSYVQFGQKGGRLKLGPVTTGGDTALDRATSALSAAQAAEAIAADAQAVADGKVATYYQATPPATPPASVGDLWFDTDDGNKQYVHVGLGLFIAGTEITIAGTSIDMPWALASDQRIGEALTAAAGAQATADGKVTTFYAEAAPVAEALGDLWYQPSTKILRRWSGSAWAETSSLGAPVGTEVGGMEAGQLVNAANQAKADAENAKADAEAALSELDEIGADGWLHPSEKLLVAREFQELTDEKADINAKAAAAGATAENNAYNAAYAALSSYLDGLSPAWNSTAAATSISRTVWNTNWKAVYAARQLVLNKIADIARALAEAADSKAQSALTAAQAAQALAQNAQAVADGKVATYYQATPPATPPASVGDLWFDTDDGNKQYVHVGLGLFIAGTEITIAGTSIDMPWALASDQRIGEALTAAAGAQATADGKVTTFYAEAAPVAEALGDLWYQPSTKILRRWSGSAWAETSSLGAPPGTQVGDRPAEEVATVAVNFNRRNDRDGSTIVVPVVPADGTAVDHTLNTDGSADVSFEWTWSGSNDSIDGFIGYARFSDSSAPYTMGTAPAEEQAFQMPADKRALILYGVPANKYITFGVRAFRVVDSDIASSGIIQTPIIQPTRAEERPYRPSATVAMAGDITGTVAGTPATVIVGKTQNLTPGGNLNPAIGIDTGVLRTLGRDISIVKLRDGETFTFPSDWGTGTPAVVGMMNGMISPTEFIETSAINVTSASFTARCKKVTAVSGVQTQITAAATPSAPRSYEKVKANADIAFGDRFTFRFSVNVMSGRQLYSGEWEPGSVTLGFWTFDGVTWQRNTSATYGSRATQSATTYSNQSVSVVRPGMGNGSRFGISVESNLYGGGPTSFASVDYNAVTSVSEATATPPGFPGMDFLIVGGGKVA